jgi:hypothetical protein
LRWCIQCGTVPGYRINTKAGREKKSCPQTIKSSKPIFYVHEWINDWMRLKDGRLEHTAGFSWASSRGLAWTRPRWAEMGGLGMG